MENNEEDKKVPQFKGLSVIIVSYNVRSFLSSCLDSVLHASKKCSQPVEIIVVDNQSQDGTVKILKPKYSEVTWVVSESNMGFGSACNRGARLAKHDLLLFLNPDTIVEENTLQVMVDFFLERENLGAVGCRILNSDHTLQPASKRSFPSPWEALYKLLGLSYLFPKSKIFSRYNLSYLDEMKEHEVDAVSGSFICTEASLFKKVGGFDEEYFMYGEDLDLCYKFKQAGRKNIYTPKTNIVHFKGESSKSRPLKSLFHFYSSMIIFSRRHSEIRLLPLPLIQLGVFVLGWVNFITQRAKNWKRWTLDLVLVNLVLFVSTQLYFRFRSDLIPITEYELYLYLKWHGWLSLFSLLSIGYSGDYGVQGAKASKVGQFLIVGILLFFTLGYFFNEESFSRIALGGAGVTSWLLLVGWRFLGSKSGPFFRDLSGEKRRILILGINNRSLTLRDLILSGDLQGFEFYGFVSVPGEDFPEERKVDVISEMGEMGPILKKLGIHELLIVLDENSYPTALTILSQFKEFNLPVKILVGEPKPRSITLVDLNYS